MGSKAFVDYMTAKNILEDAYQDALANVNCSHPLDGFIDSIISGNHLTFKYILFTALLAKASNADVNPLCLQAHSTLDGAYDARSLCHQVIVPFEKEKLKKILGGSNEPFLNKPARFPELSLSNAVRKGKDKQKLESLCANLPKLSSQMDARSALTVFLKKAIDQIEVREKNEMSYLGVMDPTRNEILEFLKTLLDQNQEGESLTLVVANLYHLLYLGNKSIEIDVHPVNECGACGKQVSDMDVIEEGMLVIANELKDKDFCETDISHAADKVLEAGGDQMYFIVGPDARFIGDNLSSLVEEYKKKNFILTVIDVNEFIDMVFPLCRKPKFDDLLIYTSEVLKEKKFKKTTAAYFYDTVEFMRK